MLPYAVVVYGYKCWLYERLSWAESLNSVTNSDVADTDGVEVQLDK